nr:TlpA disulfide reductase family protein [Echinimonas agarilytica]
MHSDGVVLKQSFVLPKLHRNGSAELATLNTESTDSSQFIYFVAPWCSVCKVSLPNLENVYKDNPKATISVVVLSYENADEVVRMMNQLDLSVPLYLGNSSIQSAFNIPAYPSWYLFSHEGKVEGRGMGYSTELGLRWTINGI